MTIPSFQVIAYEGPDLPGEVMYVHHNMGKTLQSKFVQQELQHRLLYAVPGIDRNQSFGDLVCNGFHAGTQTRCEYDCLHDEYQK